MLAASTAAADGLERLDVPLTIWEVAGVERKNEPCSTGVPLPCSLLAEPEGIAVFSPDGTPVPAQFRVLERWREAGLGKDDESIKWLLVTFLADVPSGGKSVYHLRAGPNPAPPQPVRIEQNAAAFQMAGLVFKKDFSGPFQLVLTDPEGKRITAADLPVTWSVWEQGPIRAAVKAETPTVPGKFGFIAWIYAYAGQRRWDMTVVLKNTPRTSQGPLYFKDFSVVWEPSGLKDARDFLLGGEWGKAVCGTLADGKPACLYQDSDGTDAWQQVATTGNRYSFTVNLTEWIEVRIRKFLSTRQTPWREPGGPTFRGYKVTAGGNELAAGSFPAGWAGLNGTDHSGLLCVRHFCRQYPKAVEVAPGTLHARLWPTYWRGHGGLHWLDDCQRKAHDVSFRILPGSASPERGEAASRAFDSPLVIHCGLDWYRRIAVCSGATARPPGRSGIDWYGGPGVSGFIPADVDANESAPRIIAKQAPSHHNWVTFGGNLTDRIRRYYHDCPMDGFVRSGSPQKAYRTFISMRHSAGMTPFWVDDYHYPRDRGMIGRGYCTPPRAAGAYRSDTRHHGFMAWNNQHLCCAELFDSWRLFGDPLALEAAADVARYVQFYADYRTSHGIGETRLDALPMTVLCEGYRVTGDPSYLASAKRLARIIWKTVNTQRGYYWASTHGHGDKGLPYDKPFMISYLMSGLRTYCELTGDEDAADQITGMTDFVMAEGSLGEYGFTYFIRLDPEEQAKNIQRELERINNLPKAQRRAAYGGHVAPHMAWCYQYTGDVRYRKGIERLCPTPAKWDYTNYGPPKTDTIPPAAVNDLAVEALGGGKVRLTWTAPAGQPARYQVKWADKPMVRRITWPEQKDTHANWWAANNVAGEPRPAAAGTKQSMVVEGVTAGMRCFAIRSFDAAGNRSAKSNMARADVR